jgi:hypothetical protein
MNYYKKSRYVFLFLISMCAYNCSAAEEIKYQDWAVQLGDDTVEAYTVNSSQSSFGFFCKGETCLYYLNLNLECPANSKTPVLLSGEGAGSAFLTTCMKLGGRNFQILDEPELVKRTVYGGKKIGFSVALQGGEFILAQFTLNGAQVAIERAVAEAKQKKVQPKGSVKGIVNI